MVQGVAKIGGGIAGVVEDREKVTNIQAWHLRAKFFFKKISFSSIR